MLTFIIRLHFLIRRDKEDEKRKKKEEDKKQPLSLEEMLEKRAAEQAALAKVMCGSL